MNPSTNEIMQTRRVTRKDTHSTSKISLLRCCIGEMEYGFEISAVSRVEEYLDTTDPGVPTDVRHSIRRNVPIIDATSLFCGDQGHHRSDNAKDVVLSYGSQTITITVDSVHGIYTASTDELETWYEPPAHPTSRYIRALLPVGDRVIHVVDVRRILRQRNVINDECTALPNTRVERSDIHG